MSFVLQFMSLDPIHDFTSVLPLSCKIAIPMIIYYVSSYSTSVNHFIGIKQALEIVRKLVYAPVFKADMTEVVGHFEKAQADALRAVKVCLFELFFENRFFQFNITLFFDFDVDFSYLSASLPLSLPLLYNLHFLSHMQTFAFMSNDLAPANLQQAYEALLHGESSASSMSAVYAISLAKVNDMCFVTINTN